MKTISEFFNDKKKAAAMTVMVRDEKALILMRSHHERWMPGFWNLPGGGIEEGETPQQAAVRECEEESGITPEDVKSYRLIRKAHIDLHVFTGTCDEDAMVMLDPMESMDYVWVDLDRLENYRFVPDCRELIRKVLQDLVEPPVGVAR